MSKISQNLPVMRTQVADYWRQLTYSGDPEIIKQRSNLFSIFVIPEIASPIMTGEGGEGK